MINTIFSFDKELLIKINQTGKISYDAFWLIITNAWNWIPFLYSFCGLIFIFFLKK